MPKVNVSDSYRAIGVVGMCVNGLFLCICSWRLLSAVQANKFNWVESRVLLHISIIIFSLLEFVYQASIYSTDKICAWGYFIHLIAVNVNLVSFCLIFIRFIVWSNVSATIPSMVIIFIKGAAEEYWPILFVGAIVESSTLLFTATWLFIYSIQLRERIARVVTHSSVTDPTARKQSSVQRIVYVLFTCSCTYLARIFCLSLLGVDLITGSSRTSRFTNLGWFIISNWIPTIIPGLLFLYTSRILGAQSVDKIRTLREVFSTDYSEDGGPYEDTTEDSERTHSASRALSVESFSGEMRRLQLSGRSSESAGHEIGRGTSGSTTVGTDNDIE